jgi:hypothetical protein
MLKKPLRDAEYAGPRAEPKKIAGPPPWCRH